MTAVISPSDHVLRTADGAVIDVPFDLVHSDPSSRPSTDWVCSWYPLPGEPGRLVRADWLRARPRGHLIPLGTASGDVIEFGLSRLTGGPEEPVVDNETIVRWFGWLNYGTDRALVVNGPYPTLGDAVRQAGVVVDLIRLDQLDPGKSFDPRRTDPTAT